jgi:hypothetical protein
MKTLQRIWNDIRRGETVDLYLMVAAAFVVGVLNILGSAPEAWVTSVILAALGVLAVSALRMDARLANYTVSQVTASKILLPRKRIPPADLAFAGAKRIEVLAISLLTMATTYHTPLKQKRDSGCHIRLILTNPANRIVADLIAQRLPEASSPEIAIAHSQTAASALGKIVGTHPSGGSLEARVLDTLPPFGLFIIDGDTPNGTIRVELYPDNCPVPDRPVFELHASRDGDWYTFFYNQFETLWHKAAAVGV